MASLDKNYFEIGRDYETISKNYKRPYILGVDIEQSEKPFIVASGDNHSDIGAKKVTLEELISGRWDSHIRKAGCTDFLNKLKDSVSLGESFPPKFLISLVNSTE